MLCCTLVPGPFSPRWSLPVLGLKPVRYLGLVPVPVSVLPESSIPRSSTPVYLWSGSPVLLVVQSTRVVRANES